VHGSTLTIDRPGIGAAVVVAVQIATSLVCVKACVMEAMSFDVPPPVAACAFLAGGRWVLVVCAQ